MQKINISMLKEIVRDVVIGLNEPVLVVGQFGAGKSVGICQACDEADAFLVDIRLGQYDSVDIRGIPTIEKKRTVWNPASTLPFKGSTNFPKDKPIVIFFDEITSATVPVLGVTYQIINERRCGEFELMDNVRIICAGNRKEDKGIVNRIPEPLKNRCTQYEVVVDTDDLCQYGYSVGWKPEFMALWKFKPDIVCTWDATRPVDVVATPRTWEKAIKYYNSNLSQSVKEASIIGAIGEGPATELWAFIRTWQSLVPIKDILKDPLGVLMPRELSARYATAMNVSGNLNLKNAGVLMQYLQRLDTECGAPELYIMAMDMALGRDKSLFAAPSYVTYAKRYQQAVGG